jgi:DNA-binding winged helix-turn-helix (wHTH) protein
MSRQSPTRFSFGPFVLDVEGVELRKGPEKVSIRPKCFDVLVYLLDQPGRVVSKEELLEKVWPDVVVNDATLNRTVTELRAALGDDADHPRYVETVSRRGYKFIASTSAPAAPVETDLVLAYGDQEFPLPDGEHIIGRGADVAVPIFASATSRHHARVVVAGNSVTVEDLGSRNGTYVNGTRVEGSVELHTGDEIRIGGDCLVLWSRSGETESLRTSPPKPHPR